MSDIYTAQLVINLFDEREMYKPDPSRLAKFWSTFQVFEGGSIQWAIGGWTHTIPKYVDMIFLFETIDIQDTWSSLYGSRLPTVAAITGHRYLYK